MQPLYSSSSAAAPLRQPPCSSSSTAAPLWQPPTAAPLWQPPTAAPLWQLLFGSLLPQLHYGSSSTATTQRQPAGFRPLTPSWSFCNVKPLQSLPLACSSAGVYLSLPSGPCHHHTYPAAIMRPLPPPCGPCHCPAELPRH
jgi:hypothetical protein